jgi:hypothetical protein
MWITLASLGIQTLSDMFARDDLLNLPGSPLLPVLGTSAFILVTGYYWRKHQRRPVAARQVAVRSCNGHGRRTKRRKTLLLTPITLEEVSFFLNE